MDGVALGASRSLVQQSFFDLELACEG